MIHAPFASPLIAPARLETFLQLASCSFYHPPLTAMVMMGRQRTVAVAVNYFIHD